MSSSSSTAAPVLLPNTGSARVKNVMSGDTVVLWGKVPAPGVAPPQVQFTLEGLLSPRLASKNYPTDDPGAFPAREFLRKLLVGKQVKFETTRRKPQGGGVGTNSSPQSYNHFGHLFFEGENVAVSILKNGFAKVRDDFSVTEKTSENGGSEDDGKLKKAFADAYQIGASQNLGIHAGQPLVRSTKAVEKVQEFMSTNPKVTAVIEYVFDGSRFRCQVTKANDKSMHYASFTLVLGGVITPRSQRPTQQSDNPIPTVTPNANWDIEEQNGARARLFAEERLLHRELEVSFHGTDKSGSTLVGTVHHPKGNITVELLKNGLARMADWSVRLMDPTVIPPLRFAENNAKRERAGLWAAWEPPKLSGAGEITGTCIEVVSGDTVTILPAGTIYDSEDSLRKVSLASIRSPRLGNERVGRADEPYAWECKERLRVLCAGKQLSVNIHYEREIPLNPSVTEKRQFGTVSVGKRADVAEVLVSEGLAQTQRHRDDDEKSPRYDDLRAAEATAKAAKKNMHSEAQYKKPSINDLTEPKKAKAYSGSLLRTGSLKAVVEYVFNGGRFKVYIPSENCSIMFAPDFIRCPQPTPVGGAAAGKKAAEPFGDASKRYARTTLLQRTIEINCSGITNGGVLLGSLHVGQGGQKREFSLELVSGGLATVDQRKIDYGEAPKRLVDAQTAAQKGKVGVWSLEPVTPAVPQVSAEKKNVQSANVRLSEIRSGSHFFFHKADDDSAKVVEDSMKAFTSNNGTKGAACEMKIGKFVAALFNDGSGPSWYRAKIVEKPVDGKVTVLFVDHGNLADVPVSTHLRPLDLTLGPDRIPPVASEAVLALTTARSLETDDGYDAAGMLQSTCWGKDLTAQIFGPDMSGRLAVALFTPGASESINEEMVSAGLARVDKKSSVDSLIRSVKDGSAVLDLSKTLNVAQEKARRSRAGMWRYGDIGDDDDDM